VVEELPVVAVPVLEVPSEVLSPEVDVLVFSPEVESDVVCTPEVLELVAEDRVLV